MLIKKNNHFTNSPRFFKFLVKSHLINRAYSDHPIYLFIYFMLQKALLFPFGPRLERGLQDVKKLPSGCREGLQAALMLGGFFKGQWSPEVPSCA